MNKYNYTTISISKPLRNRLAQYYFKDKPEDLKANWNKILTEMLNTLESKEKDNRNRASIDNKGGKGNEIN